MSANRRLATLVGHLQVPTTTMGGAAASGVFDINQCACPFSGAASASNTAQGSTCPAMMETVPAHVTPKRVVVTGAAGNIAYAILFMIGQGKMLGPHQPVELRLLDLPSEENKLRGVEMELVDCAFPLVKKIVPTSDYKVAFTDADICLLIGAKPRSGNMQRKDLLEQNAAIFSGQGKAINQYASRNVKVCVVGNPANTNALITMLNAPNIPKQNFSALTRLDHNRATAQIAAKLNVPMADVQNVIIWGNHSSTQYPDVSHATVKNYPTPGLASNVRSAVNDNKWLDGKFIKDVQERGAAIIAARKLSSAASAANATVDHMRSWILGTPAGVWVSMAVISDGSYGAPKDVMYSFPVTCQDGNWKIVQGLAISEESRKLMKVTGDELVQEKTAALAVVQ